MGCRCQEFHSSLFMLHFSESRMTTEVMTTMSQFDAPEQLFPLVHSLKAEGNKLVKEGKYKHANAIYTKAATFLILDLPCCGRNSHPFRDLAIPIALNFALCALKLSEFLLAKRLCDCVLHFEPSNAKALFRRAKAALRSGQLTVAQNDLTMVRKIKPNNRDVATEWSKLLLLLDKSPIAPAPAGDSSGVVDMDKDATTTQLGVRPFEFNPFRMPAKKRSKLVEPVRSESVDSNLNEGCGHSLVESNANFHDSVRDPLSLRNELEDVNSKRPQRPSSNPNLAEPKRFLNQSRPGSFINLSQSDYRKLAAGRVLQFSLPHSTSFMSVRVKRVDTDLISSPEVAKSHKSSSIAPDVLDSFRDNKGNSFGQNPIACCAIDSDPIPVSLVHNPPMFLVPSASTAEPNANTNARGNFEGLCYSRPVRPRPLAMGACHGPNIRRSTRVVQRVSKNRVHLAPGMKRKNISNYFISSYPLWKRRVPLNRYELGYAAVIPDSDLFSALSNNKVKQWKTNPLGTSSKSNFGKVQVQKLTTCLASQDNFSSC